MAQYHVSIAGVQTPSDTYAYGVPRKSVLLRLHIVKQAKHLRPWAYAKYKIGDFQLMITR